MNSYILKKLLKVNKTIIESLIIIGFLFPMACWSNQEVNPYGHSQIGTSLLGPNDPDMDLFLDGNISSYQFHSEFVATGPDGIKRKISAMKPTFTGTIELKLEGDWCIGQYKQIVDVGWTLAEYGEVTMRAGAGGLWDYYTSPSAMARVAVSRYHGVSTDYVYTTSYLPPSIYVYVTDGPRGMYTVKGWLSRSLQIYVYESGDEPNLIGVGHVGDGGGECPSRSVQAYVETPPIIDPGSDLVCDFWFDDDTLDLGIVDQKSAENASTSARLNGVCNGDASVNLRASPSEMKMGGLTIRLMFDDYNSDRKSNWNLREDMTTNTPLWAVVTNVGNVVPGDYSKSGVVYIDYN